MRVLEGAAAPGAGAGPRKASSATDQAWRVVLGAGLCMFCGQPAVAMYTFGVFVSQIVSAMHWQPTVVASAIAPGALAAALLSPFVGWATDRFGARRIALVGGPMFGVGLILLGFLPTGAASFVTFTILMWVLSFAGSPVAYAQTLTGWFDRKRGLALSAMFGMGALGIAVWPVVVARLITLWGWRAAYITMGLTVGMVILGAALFLLEDAPRCSATATAKHAAASTLSEAVATARFWKVAAVFTILTGVLAGIAVNLPIILHQRGIGAERAALVMTVIGVTMFIGRVALGPLLDRWFSPLVTIGIVLFPIGGFALLLWGGTDATIYVAAAMLGFGLGSEFNAAAYIVGRTFGSRSFGTIYGAVTLLYGLGGAAGPAAIGVSLAYHTGPEVIYTICLALLVVTVGILSTLRPKDLPY